MRALKAGSYPMASAMERGEAFKSSASVETRIAELESGGNSILIRLSMSIFSLVIIFSIVPSNNRHHPISLLFQSELQPSNDKIIALMFYRQPRLKLES